MVTAVSRRKDLVASLARLLLASLSVVTFNAAMAAAPRPDVAWRRNRVALPKRMKSAVLNGCRTLRQSHHARWVRSGVVLARPYYALDLALEGLDQHGASSPNASKYMSKNTFSKILSAINVQANRMASGPGRNVKHIERRLRVSGTNAGAVRQ